MGNYSQPATVGGSLLRRLAAIEEMDYCSFVTSVPM